MPTITDFCFSRINRFLMAVSASLGDVGLVLIVVSSSVIAEIGIEVAHPSQGVQNLKFFYRVPISS
jgi:hypothetical protein